MLSTGEAREHAPTPPDQEYAGTRFNIVGVLFEGYPKEFHACSGVATGPVKDPAALELDVRVPTNAVSFSFDLILFTHEFPRYICSKYNDFYVTMMWPKPPTLADPNISFDSVGNTISVNSALLQVCTPQTAKGKDFLCPLGPSLLQGTGFEGNAATGWLVTKAPVTPGSMVKLRFAIWDSADCVLDSTVLLDGFTWDLHPVADIPAGVVQKKHIPPPPPPPAVTIETTPAPTQKSIRYGR